MTEPTDQQVVDKMLEIREKISALTKEYEAEKAKLKQAYERGENWLLARMQETGHKSFKVDGATVFTKTNKRYSFGDWNGFAAWVQKTGNVELLQHRVSSTNMDTFVKESEGELPPGIKVDPVVSVNIRKS